MSSPASPSVAAARAILAKVKERGDANAVGQLEAHGLVRQALGVEQTTPATWQATRAALDAIHAGGSEEAVAAAIEKAHADPKGTYPAHLYGTGQASGPSDGGVEKPSQWVGPNRRASLLAASRLGRTVLDHEARHK